MFLEKTAAEVHDPSTIQQSLSINHMEQKKKKEDYALSTLIVNQYAPQRGLKKESKFSSLVQP